MAEPSNRMLNMITTPNNNYPTIFAITEQGEKLPINAKRLLIELNDGRKLSLDFDFPHHEISLRSYWGDNELAKTDKFTTISVTPGACNVIHLDVNTNESKSC